jgi:hypothetical protein
LDSTKQADASDSEKQKGIRRANQPRQHYEPSLEKTQCGIATSRGGGLKISSTSIDLDFALGGFSV